MFIKSSEFRTQLNSIDEFELGRFDRLQLFE